MKTRLIALSSLTLKTFSAGLATVLAQTGGAIAADSTTPPAPSATAKPNIIMFLVDDMGWQDTSVPFWNKVTPQNKKFHTPNMERLAAQGMKFTQAYACPLCSPSRVSLLSGQNAARHRVTNWTLYKNQSKDAASKIITPPQWNFNGLQPVGSGIPRTVEAKCLPKYLSESGYRTIMVGKAHFAAIKTPGEEPKHLGFDVNIAGHAAGGPGSYLGAEDYGNKAQNSPWGVPGLDKYHGTDTFLTEALTLEALKAVDQAQADKKPFFLYMSHYAVHVPYAPDKRFYDKYKKAGLDHIEAMYAALIEGMDKSLGDIMDYLEKNKLTDNTIILFMSDNGGVTANCRGGKPFTHNLPLSGGKCGAHEGGIREPMIVKWPGITKPGSSCNNYLIIEDFFPTILELAGVKHEPVDGVSFVPMLKGGTGVSKDRPLIWHYPQTNTLRGPGYGTFSAIRKNDWKYIFYYDRAGKGRQELYNLTDDIGETKNLAEANPEKAKELAADLKAYLQKADAQFPLSKRTGKPIEIQ